MFNSLLVQSVHEGEILTSALQHQDRPLPQHPLLKQCIQAAQQFLSNADAVTRLAIRVAQLESSNPDRSGNHT